MIKTVKDKKDKKKTLLGEEDSGKSVDKEEERPISTKPLRESPSSDETDLVETREGEIIISFVDSPPWLYLLEMLLLLHLRIEHRNQNLKSFRRKTTSGV